MSDGTPEKAIDTRVLEWNPPDGTWFVGRKHKVSANRLDRHLGFPKATRWNSKEAA